MIEEPLVHSKTKKLMRIITLFFVIVFLALSVLAWNITSDTRLLSSRVKKAKDEISAVKQEQDVLLKYKSQTPLPLDKFYLEVFSDIKELFSYYRAVSEIKIIGSKDLVNTREFFKESQYKGIRYVDVLCRLDFRGQPYTYLFDRLCKLLKPMPVEVLEVSLEKSVLNLTMRLYGT